MRTLRTYSGVSLLAAIGLGFAIFEARDFTRLPWRYVFDDAFISLRYSQNLADGYGLRWNVADPPVEGYTNALWVLVMTIPLRFHLEPIAAAHWINLGLTLLMGTAAAWTLRRVFELSWLATLFGYTLILFHPLTMPNMLSAMETTLFASLVITDFGLFAAYAAGHGEGYLKAGALVGILAGLARPEGTLFLALFSASALLRSANRPRAVRLLLLFGGLPGLAYLIWKWLYFGMLLPLPFLVKFKPTDSPFWTLPGRGYVRDAVFQTFYGPLMLALSAMGLSGSAFHGQRGAIWIRCMIAYASQRFGFIELNGLNDRFIAQHQSNMPALLDYLFGRRPDLIAIYISPNNGNPVWAGSHGPLGTQEAMRLLFQMPIPSLTEVRAYWETHPAGYAEVEQLAADRRQFFDERDRQTRLLYPRLDEQYGFARAAGKRTLELGCGMGYNAQRLAQFGARLVVMDLAERAVRLTRERFALRNLRADFLIADAERLPFAADSFEMVFSSGVIHHTPHTERAAGEIARIVRPGGQIAVMVYHRDSIWFWWNIVIALGALMLALNALPPFLRERAIAARPAWRDYLLPPGRRLTLNDAIRAGTDFGGLKNPLSRVYTRRSARALFHAFQDFRFVATFQNFRPFDERPSAFTRLWRRVVEWANARWGWFLIIHAAK